MGSRANYLLIEQGRPHLFYTHWGAQHVDRDFFFGPDVALGVVRSARPVPLSEMLDDVWSEGGALLDLDRRRLRLWGGEGVSHEVGPRQVWLELLRISWPGWDVRWADRGILELAEAAGVPPRQVRSRQPPLEPFRESLLRPIGSLVSTFVTLRRPAGPQRDVALPARPSHYLAAGPRLLDLLNDLPEFPPPPEAKWPSHCLLLDEPRRSMWVTGLWWGTFDPLTADAVAAHWPGWSIHLHNEGMLRHLAFTGRDAAPLRRPVQDHLKVIARTVTGADTDPAVLLQTMLSTRPPEEREIQLNPHFLQKHSLDLPPERRMDHFLKVVSQWRAGQR